MAVRHLRIVSIGCGGGEVDLAFIKGLSDSYHRWGYTGIDFVGLEPNLQFRSEFMERIKHLQNEENMLPSFTFKLVDGTFNPSNSSMHGLGGADVVLLAHVLYYFEDKAATLQSALQLNRAGGKTLVVHQDTQGVPELQIELLPELRGSIRDMFTAEGIHEILTGQLSDQVESFVQHSVDAFLDISEVLKGTEDGMKIMSFCLEADHRTASSDVLQRSCHAFERRAVAQAESGRGGGPFLKEPVSCFIISPKHELSENVVNVKPINL